MSFSIVSLILDCVVLGFLAATIFYAFRLSRHLQEFKAQRKAFDHVITDLLSSIDQAERSIQNLKDTGAKEASSLEDLVVKSSALLEELRVINEAGESMAMRLEKLAEDNRRAAQMSQRHNTISEPKRRHKSEDKITSPVDKRDKVHDYHETLKKVGKRTASPSSDMSHQNDDQDLPSFMINDRDFNDLDDMQDHLDRTQSNDMAPDNVSDDSFDGLQSQAERDLLSALRKSKRDISGNER